MGYKHKGHRERHDPRRAEDYADMFRNVKKWLNQCVGCQRIGRKLYIPNDGDDRWYFRNIRRNWDVLEVNEIGLCVQCQGSRDE